MTRQYTHELIKAIGKQKDLLDNQLRDVFSKEAVEYIDFEGIGKVRFYTQAGKKNPQLDYRGIREDFNTPALQKLAKEIFESIKNL